MKDSIKQSLKLGFVVLVVAAVGTTGVAIAQSGDDAEPDSATTQSAERHDFRRGGPGDHHRGGSGGFGVPGVLGGEVADLLGLAPSEILSQLNDGASLAELADANGSSGQEVIDTMIAGLTDRLEGAVAEERITQEQADERIADATARVTEFVNTNDPLQAAFDERQASQVERMAEREAQHQAVLDLLGLTDDELRAAVQSGQTLGQVAEAQGVTVDQLVDVMIAPLAADLADKVAAGDLTQAEADEKLAEAQVRITERIENGDGPGRRGHGGRGFGPGGPRGGFGSRDGGPPAVDSVFGSGVTIDA